MNAQQEIKIANESLKMIVNTCKLEGFDYFTLDKKTQILLIAVFQTGVGAVNKIIQRLDE